MANLLETNNEISPSFDFQDRIATTPLPGTLGPKETSTGPALSVYADTLNKIREHQGHLYFWGWVTYRDILPKTPEHVAMYCIELSAVHGNPIPSVPDGTKGNAYVFDWQQCPLHNCTDDECIGQPYGNPVKIWK